MKANNFYYEGHPISLDDLENLLLKDENSQMTFFKTNIDEEFHFFDNNSKLDNYLSSIEYLEKIKMQKNDEQNPGNPIVEQGGFQLSFYSSQNCNSQPFPVSFAIPQFGGTAEMPATPFFPLALTATVPRDGRMQVRRYFGPFSYSYFTYVYYFRGVSCDKYGDLFTPFNRTVVVTSFNSSFPG